ncbi:MAG: hypothetical protein NVS3B18_06510 [Candidatus Dormibacteria bacterium]
MQGWMMMVEPTEDGGIRIEGQRAGGLSIEATVTANGRCHTLVVKSSTAAIDSDLLKTLSLATLLRRAVTAVPGIQVPVERSSKLSDARLKRVAAAYNRGVRAHPSRPRKAVAELWLELARKRGEKYPEDKVPPASTVGRWIEAAADRGYLPKNPGQGRARIVSQRSRTPRGGRTATPRSRKRSLSPYSELAG